MTTECYQQPLLFSSLKTGRIQLNFKGGAIITNAGGLLLKEVDRRSGLP